MESKYNSLHITAFVNNFIVKTKRERFIYLWLNNNRHDKAIDVLNHFALENFINAVTINDFNSDSDAKTNANKVCYLISPNKLIDNSYLNLSEAITAIEQQYCGSIISVVPGQLAYYRCEITLRNTFRLKFQIMA